MGINKLLLGMALPLGLIAPAVQASAQSLPQSDTLTVYDSSGNIVVSPFADEANENASAITIVPIAFDPAQFDNATALTEPNGTISDVFGICTGCGSDGGEHLGFASDTEIQGVPYIVSNYVPERNGIIDATKYLSPDLQRLGFTAQFVSDVVPVPEPASWAMMLLGFGGIGLAVRRRRKQPRNPILQLA